MKSNLQFKIYAQLAVLCCLLVPFFATGLQAQSLICAGEELCLTVPARGTVQWEQSPDQITWTAMPGATNDTSCIFPTQNSWYRAEVADGSCDVTYSDPVLVQILPGVLADAGSDIDICLGDSTILGGSPAGAGGTGALSYSWSPTAGLSNAMTANPMASPSSNTDYILTVTDSVGCIAMDTASVVVNALPTVDAGADTTVTCSTSVNLGGNPTASGGAGGYAYSWTPGVKLNSPNVANPFGVPGNSTVFTVAVTDSLGCSATDSVAITTTGQANGNVTFSYTGAVQFFVVPVCADSIEADVYGAQGGSNSATNTNYGGRVTAKFAFNPGDTLWVYVGEQPSGLTGGWNGGGNGESAGAGGGGASDIRVNGQTFNDRVIVGGGAGGGGFWSNMEVVGGVGGGLVGGPGYRSITSTVGGDPGTQTSSGNGTCASFNNPICAGGFGFGGAPSNCGCEGYGGGGGWWGGAGSGNCRGGGGGSGYTAPSASSVVHQSGVRIGHGQVILTW